MSVQLNVICTEVGGGAFLLLIEAPNALHHSSALHCLALPSLVLTCIPLHWRNDRSSQKTELQF